MTGMKPFRPYLLPLILFLLLPPPPAPAADDGYRCQPTAEDAQGPFYRSGAPLRSRIGAGYLLTGEVKSAVDCRPLAGARIELWMTGPDGRYDERWRATTFSGRRGRYSLESYFPGRYGSRPPHIHIMVSAPGFTELITQHYPLPGTARGVFDLVLRPAR